MGNGAICDFRIRDDRRTRQRCPFHKRMEYGRLVTMYDTSRVVFDCGTMVDYGYGYYELEGRAKQEDKEQRKARRLERGLARAAAKG